MQRPILCTCLRQPFVKVQGVALDIGSLQQEQVSLDTILAMDVIGIDSCRVECCHAHGRYGSRKVAPQGSNHGKKIGVFLRGYRVLHFVYAHLGAFFMCRP